MTPEAEENYFGISDILAITVIASAAFVIDTSR